MLIIFYSYRCKYIIIGNEVAQFFVALVLTCRCFASLPGTSKRVFLSGCRRPTCISTGDFHAKFLYSGKPAEPEIKRLNLSIKNYLSSVPRTRWFIELNERFRLMTRIFCFFPKCGLQLALCIIIILFQNFEITNIGK